VLDHTQYARWLPVFVQDLKVLSVEYSSLFAQLLENMPVCTSNAKFSDIAFDHKYEQMNKEIKSTCGYIYLVYKEDHDFFRKLDVCCPEINQFLSEIGTDDVRYQNTENKLPSFVQKFVQDCQSCL
jgi:hypothetical protein